MAWALVSLCSTDSKTLRSVVTKCPKYEKEETCSSLCLYLSIGWYLLKKASRIFVSTTYCVVLVLPHSLWITGSLEHSLRFLMTISSLIFSSFFNELCQVCRYAEQVEIFRRHIRSKNKVLSLQAKNI